MSAQRQPTPFESYDPLLPNEEALLAEAPLRQLYRFFRPWFSERRVVDMSPGDGFGIAYAGALAGGAIGVYADAEDAERASRRHPSAEFTAGACAEHVESGDLVFHFDFDPKRAEDLDALAQCAENGADVVLAWDPHRVDSYACDAALRSAFGERDVRWLYQGASWPGPLSIEAGEEVQRVVAIVSESPLPDWPRVGFDLHTYDNAEQARAALLCARASYPGVLEFALVANGCAPEQLERLRTVADDFGHFVNLIEVTENVGGTAGANIGLAEVERIGYDVYGVMSDDVLCTGDAIAEMVSAMAQLDAAGYRPGVIGVVSNYVSGLQQVELGPMPDWDAVTRRAESNFAQGHDSVRRARQVRPLCMLIHPDCLAEVGGFDPVFGFGTFDDDDHNVRTHLAGFSLWIADGAFAYHFGSMSFKRCIADYESNLRRNLEVLCRKWGVASFEALFALDRTPVDVPLRVPTGACRTESDAFEVDMNGERVDLIQQATDEEFLGWVLLRLREQGREARLHVVRALSG